MSRRTIIGKSKAPVGNPGGFKMQIQTTTSNQVFTLPTNTGCNYNATVLWGDGTQSSITEHNINNTKTYTTIGTYDIEIKGTFDTIYFNNMGSKDLVKKILSWGNSEFEGFTVLYGSFYGCSNLNSLPTDSTVKFKNNANINFTMCFRKNTSLVSLPNNMLDGLNVTVMSYMFWGCTQLSSIPNNFLGNCVLTNNLALNGAFRDCDKLQLQSNMLSNSNNFGSTIVEFDNCFTRTTFTGTQGTAPALWSATMNASSTFASCFGGAGNSSTSLTNYASIPAAWK